MPFDKQKFIRELEDKIRVDFIDIYTRHGITTGKVYAKIYRPDFSKNSKRIILKSRVIDFNHFHRYGEIRYV